MNDIQYALYHETADLSEDTLNRILEFARFAKAEEQKRTRSEKGPKESWPRKPTALSKLLWKQQRRQSLL